MAKKAKHKKEKNWWGFDTGSINKNKRPQDDFYAYANVGWLKSAAIPPEEARWGSFNILRYETELRLKKIAARTRDPLVGQIYRSAIDLKHHNKLGLKPLRPLLGHVRAAKNKEELLKTLAHFHRIGVSGFWGTFVDQDAKQSSRYILHLWQGGLGMPDRDYYLLDGLEQRRVRDAYVLHIKKLMRIAGTSKKGAERFVKTVMGIETALARGSMCKEDLRDAEKVYHKKSAHELARISPEIDWQKFFALIGVRKTKKIIVGQPKFFAAVSKIIEATPLEDLKIYLEWNLINGCAPLLSEPLVRENFNFYARTLAGVKKMRQPWRRALGAVGGCVPFALGELYVKRYFPHSAKRAIDALVDDLFLAYETRIKKLDWMSIVTKRKAVKKLRSMARKIGYPSKRKSYKGLVAKEKDFFGNMLRASEFEHRRQIKKLLQPIDRAEWHMSPQTVNAYCNFGLNEIVFPAAILQWPFFDMQADAAINYAGIGSVIAHEMTHGFDDQGSKFDHRGNMRNWWSVADRKRFVKKSKRFIAQAGAQKAAPGININGQLTLGENIADFGGLVIAWDAYQKYLREHGRKAIAGLSPEERFFLGFAQMEREAVRPEYLKTQVLTDPHAPAPWRINGPLSNFEPFYKTFSVKKDDKLYRPSSSRASMW